ncbi:hypothetical protein [Thermoactinomyces sp. DSM 45892]|uniref:hypothetical protein n=1 Tax=Thermoactinomyces sp. DSM 45892 TaxID=1882753 RepID=UPI00089BE182|nr:hypothetical protein [Thermoactinomyces sp. DSM 45892]SDY22315.1 hypothetical protein SAMN05444416_10322 [Thermoactinomyces sp. DSM 45892]
MSTLGRSTLVSTEIDELLDQYKKRKKLVSQYVEERDELVKKANLWMEDMCLDHVVAMSTMEEILKQYYIDQLSKNPRLFTIRRPLGRFGLFHEEDGGTFQVKVYEEE